MGNAKRLGDLWGKAPQGWAEIQEPLHKPLWEAMMDAAGVGSGTRFLDAGCGAGGASILAAQRGARVSGLDAAEGMIEIARRQVPNGDFRVGDIEHLPFDNFAFDVVFAASSIQFSADRIATLQEFARVCNPRGRITAGLFGPPERVAYRSIPKAIGETLPEPPSGAGPFELSAPGTLEGLFTEAGLHVLESGEVDCPFYYPDFEIFWRAISATGPAQKAQQFGGKKLLKTVVQSAAEAFRLDDGSILIQPNIFIYVVASPALQTDETSI
jgi:SAM-dependent methyltransferase